VKTKIIALYFGIASVAVGLITFVVHWNLFDIIGRPLPGYKILLFPANMSLIYVWHPLFTEEVALLPKLVLMMIGQFVLVTITVAIFVELFKKIFSVKHV
jgi:hypothetical protein